MDYREERPSGDSCALVYLVPERPLREIEEVNAIVHGSCDPARLGCSIPAVPDGLFRVNKRPLPTPLRFCS
jgi:hypothetical protein